MILGEPVLLMIVLCTAPAKKRLAEQVHFTCGTAHSNTFQMSSGVSLEHKLKIELEEIDGVRNVAVTRRGNELQVNVVLDTLAFAPFEKITAVEMDVFARFPDLNFEFNVLPAAAFQEITSTPHAA